jgi:hypothetical protein
MKKDEGVKYALKTIQVKMSDDTFARFEALEKSSHKNKDECIQYVVEQAETKLNRR